MISQESTTKDVKLFGYIIESCIRSSLKTLKVYFVHISVGKIYLGGLMEGSLREVIDN